MTQDERVAVEMLKSDLKVLQQYVGGILLRKHHCGIDLTDDSTRMEMLVRRVQNHLFEAFKEVDSSIVADDKAREVFMNDGINVKEEFKTEMLMRGEDIEF